MFCFYRFAKISQDKLPLKADHKPVSKL